MPLLVALVGLLAEVAGSLAGRVLLSLGLAVFQFTGMSLLENSITSGVWGSLGGLPAEILGLFGVLKLDVALKMILSAYGIRALLAGVSAGGILTRIM